MAWSAIRNAGLSGAYTAVYECSAAIGDAPAPINVGADVKGPIEKVIVQPHGPNGVGCLTDFPHVANVAPPNVTIGIVGGGNFAAACDFRVYVECKHTSIR